MLRILAEGSFVPNEIIKIRNKYDQKKKKNLNNSSIFKPNFSDRQINDFILSNNIGNNFLYYDNINNKRYNNKDPIDDCIDEFIENITKNSKQNYNNYLLYKFNQKPSNIKRKKANLSMDAKINSNNEHINEYQNIINENNNINNDIINDANYSNKKNLNVFEIKISGDTENQMNNINSQILNSNIDSIDKAKVQAKNKMNSLNSMDNLFVNNEYSNISDIKEKNKKGVNNSINDLNIFADDNKQRYKKLSNKLNNLNNSVKYSSVINDKRAIISKLEKSIKDFENNIKIYKNLKRTKDIECQKISKNNKKLLDNTEINREKSKEYFDIKYGFDNEDIMNEYNKIKNENMKLNEQIFTIQNEINKMNLELKLLNKKKEDDLKLCENMKQEINLYKKHSENLKKNLKVLDKHTGDIEEVLDKMNENYF